jgi:hypothetical protein
VSVSATQFFVAVAALLLRFATSPGQVGVAMSWAEVYFSEDGTRMTVLHINPDPSSLEFHMKTAGPKFPPIGEFIDMMSIDVYGEPDLAVVDQLRRKAAMLGTGTVRVHALHAGFARAPWR